MDLFETMMPTFVQFRNRSIIFQETKVGWIQMDYNGDIIVGIINIGIIWDISMG